MFIISYTKYKDITTIIFMFCKKKKKENKEPSEMFTTTII